MVINKESKILEAKKKRASIRLPADSDDVAHHGGDSVSDSDITIYNQLS